jgi:hypothetical protein
MKLFTFASTYSRRIDTPDRQVTVSKHQICGWKSPSVAALITMRNSTTDSKWPAQQALSQSKVSILQDLANS